MLGTILMIIAGLFAAIVLVGIFIPTKYRFSKQAIIQTDKKNVFNTVDDLAQWKIWSAWSPENDHKIKITYGDKQSGTGAKMMWKGSKMGKGDMEIVQSDPYKEIQMNVVFNKGVFKMEFRFLIEEEKNATKITWYVSGRTRRGGFAKILGRLLPRWMGKDMETSLKILKHFCEGNLKPSP